LATRRTTGRDPVRLLAIVVVAVIVVGALAVAFTFDLSGRAGPGATPSTVVVSAHPLIGRPAPAFSLKTLDGRTVSLADYRGRPVIVNFWASYCEPCKIEFPLFKAARERHATEGLEILGIVKADDDLDAARRFAASEGAAWPLLPDAGGTTAAAYRADLFVPISFYVDRTGIVRAVSFGPPPSGALDDQLAKIL
jgi:peroxiredoxin